MDGAGVGSEDRAACRALVLLSRKPEYGDDFTRQRRAEEIQKAARFEAVASLEGQD